MSGAHTPGPWDIGGHRYDKSISVGIGLVEGPNGYDVAEVYADDCPRELSLANARLIAAAPDLLAALEAVVASSPIEDSVLPIVLLAIAKARGQ